MGTEIKGRTTYSPSPIIQGSGKSRHRGRKVGCGEWHGGRKGTGGGKTGGRQPPKGKK